jgi:hypothetical protein
LVIIALVAAAALSAAAPKPLREVVYHVSYTRQVGASVTPAASDHGTVTVDVMAVDNNALGLKVTERFAKNPTVLVALGTVAPNGAIIFAPGALSDVTDLLLPYFAPKFAPQQALTPGVAWSVNANSKTFGADTRYSIASMQGSSVTINVKQSVTVHDATQSRISSVGSVVYEPGLLVPLSGDFIKRLAVKIGGATQSVTLRLHFARASDTREPN